MGKPSLALVGRKHGEGPYRAGSGKGGWWETLSTKFIVYYKVKQDFFFFSSVHLPFDEIFLPSVVKAILLEEISLGKGESGRMGPRQSHH